MGPLHPIYVGTALLIGASLLTWAKWRLTPAEDWAALSYYSRYSLLIGTGGLVVGHVALYQWPFSPPLNGKLIIQAAGVVLWLLAVAMILPGLLVVRKVRFHNRRRQ